MRHFKHCWKQTLSRNPTVMTEENAMEEAPRNINRSGCPGLPAQALRTQLWEPTGEKETLYMWLNSYDDMTMEMRYVLQPVSSMPRWGSSKHTWGGNHETVLIRTIAAEIHTVARRLLHSLPHLERDGESLRRGTKRLLAGEVAQWEQQVQEEVMEIEETALALQETGEFDTAMDEEASQGSRTDTSHRRRRALAAHHKHFIGEDPTESNDEGDGHCLMAMERDISPRSSSSSPDPVVPGGHLPEEDSDNEDIGDDEGATGSAVGECNSVEVEHYMAGLQRQLTSHIRWLRSNRVHWGSLQRSLIHKFQVALNGGAILQWMLGQAMLYARGPLHRTILVHRIRTYHSTQQKPLGCGGTLGSSGTFSSHYQPNDGGSGVHDRDLVKTASGKPRRGGG